MMMMRLPASVPKKRLEELAMGFKGCGRYTARRLSSLRCCLCRFLRMAALRAAAEDAPEVAEEAGPAEAEAVEDAAVLGKAMDEA